MSTQKQCRRSSSEEEEFELVDEPLSEPSREFTMEEFEVAQGLLQMAGGPAARVLRTSSLSAVDLRRMVPTSTTTTNPNPPPTAMPPSKKPRGCPRIVYPAVDYVNRQRYPSQLVHLTGLPVGCPNRDKKDKRSREVGVGAGSVFSCATK